MIFGNPYSFAIQIEHLPQWGDSYLNGVFLLHIDSLIINAEVMCEVLDIQARDLSAFITSHANSQKHFSVLPEFVSDFDDNELHTWLDQMTFPKSADEDQCWDYVVFISALSDRGIQLFAFNKDKVDWLFAASVEQGFLRKVAVDVNECCQIAQSAEEYTKHLLSQKLDRLSSNT